MLFQSAVFLFFLGVVFVIFRAMRQPRSRQILLLVVSYGFYGAWELSYLSLIAASTLVDYAVGIQLGRGPSPGRKRALLLLSLATNLGLLGTFKYADFLCGNTNTLLDVVGIPWRLPEPGLLLPVGISFFTFQSMSYTLDVYRGRLEPVEDLYRFALFVAFFPQLMSGPISKAGQLVPQLESLAGCSWVEAEVAVTRFLVGLFKKLVVADSMALFVDAVFGTPQTLTTLEAWVGTLAFAVQIYCDFSGYTDMAIGVALLFGVRLPENFNRPYAATSPRDFWRRWHITLSTWFRDYLYIPQGGSREGIGRWVMSVSLTMVLGGLWHGPSWTFVIWGAYHGLLLLLQRPVVDACQRSVALSSALEGLAGTILRRGLTMTLVCVGWAIFRSESSADLAVFASALVGFGASSGSFSLLSPLLVGLVVVAVQSLWPNRDLTDLMQRRSPFVRAFLLSGLFLTVVVFGKGRAEPFIYFQF